MPKKFQGENSKAAEARARIEDRKGAEKEKIKKEKEDALWQDEDKNVQKKNARKEQKEKKKTEQLNRKIENNKLYEEELTNVKGPAIAKTSNKVTRLQVETAKNNLTQTLLENVKKPANIVPQIALETNTNKEPELDDGARNVEEAISLLNTDDVVIDEHPERRMRAAYIAFEEKNLPIFKEQYKNMRLAQIKHFIQKEWLKSPENPINKYRAAKALNRIKVAEEL